MIGDKVADGMGTSWKGTVIRIHGSGHEPPLELNDGEATQLISQALVIKYDEIDHAAIEEDPEDELVLISRRK